MDESNQQMKEIIIEGEDDVTEVDFDKELLDQ